MDKKRLLLFVLGAIVGGTAGYIIASKLVEKEEYDWPEEEEGEEEDSEVEEIIETAEEVSKAMKKNKKGRANSKTDESTLTDYTAMYPTREKNKRPSPIELAKKYIPEEEESEENKEVYVIDLEAWTDRSSQEKVTLMYYDKDDTLCNANEDIIDNPEYLLGPDGLLSFGKKSDDKDMVYIRNKKTGTDYEVVRLHKSYAEVVLQLPSDEETPPKKGARKGKARKTNEQDDE